MVFLLRGLQAMNDKQSQIEGVKAALLAREPVNQVEANRRGWGLRLGALVYRLRGRGWPILSVRDHKQRIGALPACRGLEATNPHPHKGKNTDTGRNSANPGILRGDPHPDNTPSPA
jgi:hypothetical protein